MFLEKSWCLVGYQPGFQHLAGVTSADMRSTPDPSCLFKPNMLLIPDAGLVESLKNKRSRSAWSALPTTPQRVPEAFYGSFDTPITLAKAASSLANHSPSTAFCCSSP